MALDQGTTLAGYRVDGILGQGGMGVVYEATQISLNRKVALKVLAPHLSDDVTFRERFQREGQIQAGIDHNHIVTVYDSGDSEHGFFIAMRLIRGPNLKDMIVSRELDPGRTLRIVSPVASALDMAHEAGLIHRDVKPQNILVGKLDQAFLADFGLTKATGEKSLTKTGQFVGTFDYVSPEQIKGERATAKSDVYALAAVLYECLTGVVPYAKDSEAAVLYAHMADDPPKVTEHRPELPAALDAVIAAGMAKDPAERQASAGDLLVDTNHAFTRRMRAAFTPPGPIETPQETGIRQAEVDVSTREAEAQEPSAADAAELEETVQAGAATPEAELDVTVPGKTAEGEPPEGSPGVRGATPATVALPPDPAERATTPARPAPAAPTDRRAVMGALALLLLVVVGLGFVIGSSGGSKEETALAADNSASAGALELGFPDTWRRVADPPPIPDLKLKDQLAVGARGGTKANALAAGTTDATGPTLLPKAFLARLPAPPKRDDPVKLGDLSAYRYADLRPKGFDGRLTVYVAPTSAGVVTVACTASAADAKAFLPDCEEVAGSLKLVEGEAFALGADEDYVAKLDKAIDQLNSDRKRDVAKLRKAKSQSSQAAAATALAKDYGRAKSSLAGTEVSPAVEDASTSVTKAISSTEAAYSRMATAARNDSSKGYNAASKDVESGEASLERALTQVQQAGK